MAATSASGVVNSRTTSGEVQWDYAINSNGTSKFELVWKQRHSDTGGDGDGRRMHFVKCVGATNTGRNIASTGGGGGGGGIFVSLKSIREALESSSAQYRRRETLPTPTEPESSLDHDRDPQQWRQTTEQKSSQSSGGGHHPNGGGGGGGSSSFSHANKNNHNGGITSATSVTPATSTVSAMNNNNSNGVSNSYKSAAEFLPTQDPEHAFDYGDNNMMSWGEEERAPPPPLLPQQQQHQHKAHPSGTNQFRDTTSQSSFTANTTRSSSHNINIMANNNDNTTSELWDEDDEFETSVDDELAMLDVETIVASKPYDALSSSSQSSLSYHQLSGNSITNHRPPLRTMNGQQQQQHHQDFGNSHHGYTGSMMTSHNNNNHHHHQQRNSYPPDYQQGSYNSNYDDSTYYGSQERSSGGMTSRGGVGGGGGGGGATFGESYDINFCQDTTTNERYNHEGDSYAHGGGGGGGWNDGFGDGGGGGNDSAPLCPGHGKPCRVLTAQTSTNAGRQFYKCSMPDAEKCDFFEWVDGNSGNAFDGDAGTTTTSVGRVVIGSGGETKDVYTEVRRVFGHPGFRPGQKDVIEHAMLGRDVFVLMPTGGGKSLCYQLPAWCCPGISVVISPLLSLIEDQVQSMTKLGVESVFLNSMQSWEGEQQMIINKLRSPPAHGGIKLLYITPEKLSHSSMIKGIFKSLSDRGLISRFVVDEAHCLSDW